MRNSKKVRGFTLIELIAVLVIMAIIALIVTPLVMSIIRKARISADKRSVDAYGRSIELAIAGYLLDTGKFPTEVSQLTIEYSGSQVVCSTTQINTDSSVYLAGCTVAGRNVENYTYGSDKSPTYTAYTVGDQATYNNINYYVIKDSSASESNLTLLKETPITSSEISSYLSSTEVASKVDTTGTYVKMAYYSRDNCVSAGDESGCSADYAVSDVKQVVDVWKENYASGASEARLIQYDELIDNLEYESQEVCTAACSTKVNKTVNTPSWVYDINNVVRYWTMIQTNSSVVGVRVVESDGSASGWNVNINRGDIVVRPVITISKSSI